jgi:hypothetical protein
VNGVRLALLVVAAVAALPVAPTAGASDTNCVGSLIQTYDNVVVPPGASCSLAGARVRGNVLVGAGASLSVSSRPMGSGGLGAANPSIVEGNVQGDNASSLSIFQSRVRGDVQVKGGSGGVSFFIATVGGNVQLEAMAGRISLVAASVGGGLEVTKTTGGIDLVFNSVAGTIKVADNVVPTRALGAGMEINSNRTPADLQVVKNTGPGSKVIVGNQVGHSLQCFGNTASFVGGPNPAAKRQGQCF